MRYTTIALVVVAVALMSPQRRAAASPNDAIECAQQMVETAGARGYRLRTSDLDSLGPGQVMNYTATLAAGDEYIILACGDGRAIDIDIHLYDENGNLIDRDRSSDNRPIVMVRPAWTGEFLVRVQMYEARGAGNYVMAMLYR
jgi:hypothetical protein